MQGIWRNAPDRQEQTVMKKLSQNLAFVNNKPKPFLKWAGGKSQIIKKLEDYFPPQLKKGNIDLYFEPFVGGGAVFFHVAQEYKIKQAYLCDINRELILAYRVVREDVKKLINKLNQFSEKYYSLDKESRKSFYYEIREKYNKQKKEIDFTEYSSNWVGRAAQLIFLNKTCYNGLFRVNRKGEFNVPHGRYKKPRIVDAGNLKIVSKFLRKAFIEAADFEKIEKFVTPGSFVYFDPPYRPLSKTANFTSYSKSSFDDEEQKRLCALFKKLDRVGAKLMLSNSDPKNVDPSDDFFDRLYKDYYINRIQANRYINSRADRRGEINELVILNYDDYK